MRSGVLHLRQPRSVLLHGHPGHHLHLEGGREGARFAGTDTPDAAFHVLRGTLMFVYELSGTVGEVGMPQVVESKPAGVIVRYDVRWK